MQYGTHPRTQTHASPERLISSLNLCKLTSDRMKRTQRNTVLDQNATLFIRNLPLDKISNILANRRRRCVTSSYIDSFFIIEILVL